MGELNLFLRNVRLSFRELFDIADLWIMYMYILHFENAASFNWQLNMKQVNIKTSGKHEWHNKYNMMQEYKNAAQYNLHE